MAEVEGSDGNQYNIPDFALEDTQEKILATMKKAYKLSDADIKNAQKALSNDNKNSKAQIDALNKLGADIKDAVDGKGTFFGGLSDAATGTVGVLSTMGKVVGGVASGFGVLAASAAALAVNLSKGFGDAILPLAESGAAFGALGDGLKTTVPELMSFGLSVEEATGAVDGLRANFEILGADATNALVGKFMEMTDLGSKFGKTQAESIEYLQEEFATRQMLGFFQQRSAAVEAKAAEDMLQTQIDASKLLGKSVQEIADGVKSLFGTEDFRASFARMGPEVADIMRQSFSVLTASSVPEELMSGLAKAMSDPIMMASEEAVDTFDALTQIAAEVDPGAADEIRQNVMKFREATDIGDTKAAEKYQKEIEEQTIKLLGGVNDLDKQTKKELEIRGEANAQLMGAMANQNALSIAADKYGTEQEAQLADAAKTSSYFNNIIDLLRGSFDTLYMSVKAGIAPALETFTDAMGKMTDPKSAISMFQQRLKGISEKIVEKFDSIFGGAEKQEGAIGIVTSVLDTLGDAVEWAANKFLDFADLFLVDDDTPLMTKLGGYFMDLFADLANVVIEGLTKLWDNVSITDILTGNTDGGAVNRAKDKMEQEKNKLDVRKKAGTIDEDEYTKRMDQAKADSAKEIFTRAQDQDYDSAETLKLLERAGLAIEDINMAQLADLFPDPKALEEAIIQSGGSQEEYTDLANTISQQLQKESDQTSSVFRSGLKEELKTQSDVFKNAADAIITSAPEMEGPDQQDTKTASEKQDEEIRKNLDTRTPLEKRDEEIRKNHLANLETGTQPMPSTAIPVMTTPPQDETSAESPTSQDGTPTQAVKADPIGGDSTSAYVKELSEAIGLILNPALSAIATNTKKTASGVASLPDNIG